MRRSTLCLLLVLVVAACTGEQGEVGSALTEAPSATGDGSQRPAHEGAVPSDEATPSVVERGGELVLLGEDETRALTELGEGDGRFEHATLRPGDHDEQTVLALTRAADRYELRYLVIDERGPSDLYWFPWRLQVDPETVEHSEVPPTPVWAPDGSALAWLEWGEDGTRLRTVAWMDDDGANNPSDDTSSYRLDEVPVGAQLRRWERRDGSSVLVADDGEVEWHIELDGTARVVAMAGGLPLG